MAKRKKEADTASAATLRQRAEDVARHTAADLAAMPAHEVLALAHELQVHQIELDMQNEELRQTQVRLAEARDRYFDLYEFAPVGYFTVNRDQVIEEANLTAAALLGVDRQRLLRGKFAGLVAAECRDACYRHLAKVLDSGEKDVCDLPLVRPDGTRLVARLEILPVRAEEEGIVACRVTISDITERVWAEEAQRQAQVAAEAANRAKSQFLANVSHELRTPMNAVLNMTELALAEPLPETARDYLQTARESAALLMDLLDEILDFSRIEAGRWDLAATPFRPAETAAQVLRTLAVRASEKRLDLVCDLPDGLREYVLGDPQRLRQVLMNLVHNAVKFTDRGQVAVRAAVEHQTPEAVSLRFSVADTGIGIAREDYEKIFSAFTQADGSSSRRYGGAGLGLAICRRLVQAMGGRIWVESRPGRGSTFTFTLTLPKAEPPPDQDALPPPAAGAAAPALAPPARLLRVLLAEDTPANQKVVAAILGKRGHTLDIARNGREVLRLHHDCDFDVVLMDVQMPEMDGLAATAKIRKLADPKKARIPIIAMTAHALRGDEERFLAAGMDAYVSKPINAEELIELVERLVPPAEGQDGAAAAQSRRHNPRQPPPPEPPSSEAGLTSQPAAPVFDLAEAVAKCFGRQDLFGRMVDCFFDEARPLLEEMRAALAKADGEGIYGAAHRLRNTLLYLGAAPAGQAALRVETCGRLGELAEAAESIEELTGQLALLEQALAAHRTGTAPQPAEPPGGTGRPQDGS